VYLGIDLGTSALKALLVDDQQREIDQVSVPLEVQRPRPLWSEQDPEAWWGALQSAVQSLRQRRPRELTTVCGIGLAGQMHGAVLLDERDAVLRPAILWNDGRSASECAMLEAREPRSLLRAARMIEDGRLAAFVKERYAGWDTDFGRDILAGKRSLADLADVVRTRRIEPQPRSGHQEHLENLVNRYA
jgi:sugar (pentulose or hexulose) kinase